MTLNHDEEVSLLAGRKRVSCKMLVKMMVPVQELQDMLIYTVVEH